VVVVAGRVEAGRRAAAAVEAEAPAVVAAAEGGERGARGDELHAAVGAGVGEAAERGAVARGEERLVEGAGEQREGRDVAGRGELRERRRELPRARAELFALPTEPVDVAVEGRGRRARDAEVVGDVEGRRGAHRGGDATGRGGASPAERREHDRATAHRRKPPSATAPPEVKVPSMYKMEKR